MKIEKFHIYLADLNPGRGSEPGKIRPVVVLQTDLLNNVHPSTIICPLTTKVIKDADILRVHLSKKETNLDHDSDILVDQIRAIDNRRFLKNIGRLKHTHQQQLLENIKMLILE
jgi:mRNA interferase MazF